MKKIIFFWLILFTTNTFASNIHHVKIACPNIAEAVKNLKVSPPPPECSIDPDMAWCNNGVKGSIRIGQTTWNYLSTSKKTSLKDYNKWSEVDVTSENHKSRGNMQGELHCYADNGPNIVFIKAVTPPMKNSAVCAYRGQNVVLGNSSSSEWKRFDYNENDSLECKI